MTAGTKLVWLGRECQHGADGRRESYILGGRRLAQPCVQMEVLVSGQRQGAEAL